jgi:hypothetical protein
VVVVVVVLCVQLSRRLPLVLASSQAQGTLPDMG